MIEWAVNTLAGVSFIMLLVLLVRRPVAHLFGARWAYALWLLPLIRVFLPSIDQIQAFFFPSLLQHIFIIPIVGEAAVPPPSSDGPGQLVPIIFALWARGAAIFFLWQQASYGDTAKLQEQTRSDFRAALRQFHSLPHELARQRMKIMIMKENCNCQTEKIP